MALDSSPLLQHLSLPQPRCKQIPPQTWPPALYPAGTVAAQAGSEPPLAWATSIPDFDNQKLTPRFSLSAIPSGAAPIRL